jgi:hypothetical protein
MSTDFSIKPVGAPVAPLIVTAAAGSATASGAVAPQLPPSQSVTAVDASGSIRNGLQDSSDFVSHQAFFDRAAAAFVFQVVDANTGLVVQQFPDEIVLRRRAYFHALDLSKSEPTRLLATDLKA